VAGQFGSRRSASERYRQFVRAGVEAPTPWEALRGQIVLGSEAFVQRLTPFLRGAGTLKEVPRVQRFADRPELGALFEGLQEGEREGRNARIREAHLDHGYTLTEIADYLRLHYTTVSKVVHREN